MSDVREAILARLLAVLDTVEGFRTIARNVDHFDDMPLPAVSLIDGDEDADPSDPTRSRTAIAEVRRVRMTPQIHMACADKAEDVGTSVSTLRLAVINAVLSDAELLALTINGRSIRYDGLTTPRTESGRMAIGQAVLRFTLAYLFRADQ
jgi:hypothetical protein